MALTPRWKGGRSWGVKPHRYVTMYHQPFGPLQRSFNRYKGLLFSRGENPRLIRFRRRDGAVFEPPRSSTPPAIGVIFQTDPLPLYQRLLAGTSVSTLCFAFARRFNMS